MNKPQLATLAAFAQSLVARNHIEQSKSSPAMPSIPSDISNQALHYALLAQHDSLKVQSARISAESGALYAILDKLERDLSICQGQVEGLSRLQMESEMRFDRMLSDTTDLASVYTERLEDLFTSHFKTISDVYVSRDAQLERLMIEVRELAESCLSGIVASISGARVDNS